MKISCEKQEIDWLRIRRREIDESLKNMKRKKRVARPLVKMKGVLLIKDNFSIQVGLIQNSWQGYLFLGFIASSEVLMVFWG